MPLDTPVYSAAGVNTAPFWFGYDGTSDFFHESYRSGSRPPATFRGYQEPANGVGFAGIIASPSIEYIAVELIQPLEDGEIYNVQFSVNISGESGMTTDAIGAIFLEEDPRTSGIRGGYDVRNERGKLILDTTNWETVSGQYLSRGGERFILIGNLKGDKPFTMPLRDDRDWTYFFIDEVSVTSCMSEGIVTEILDTILCDGISGRLSGLPDAVNHQWEGQGTDRTIEISKAGTYVVNNHYDCSVNQQVFNVEVDDCDCTIEVSNLILSGTRLRIWKSLNVQSYEFFLVDGTGTYLARTTDQLFRSSELPLEAGAYFWQARLSCYGVADQLRDKMVTGKFVVQ